MAVTITDHRTIIDEGDANTAWTTTSSLTAASSEPDPIETANRLGMVVSTSTQNSYVSITSTDMSSGYLLYFWVSHRAALDTTTNGGLMIQVGDTATTVNRIGFHVAGSDKLAFTHFDGPIPWQCLVIDTATLSSFSQTVFSGSFANLALTAVTKLGVAFKTLAKSIGGSVNCFIDICYYMNPSLNDGCAISVTGGTSGDPGTFTQIAAADRGVGDVSGGTAVYAVGIIRELGTGLYGLQGPIRFGNATGTSSSWFEDKNVAIAFEDRDFQTTKYKIVIVDNGTGTTTFKLGTKIGTGSSATGGDGCSLTVPTGVGGLFDAATDTDVTDVFIYGSTFSGFSNGIKLRTGHEFIGCTVNTSGTIEAGGATLVNTAVAASTATRALLWDVNADTSSKLDGMSFSSSGTGHAIELGTNCPSEITFNNITFSSYATSNGSTGNECLYNNSQKSITINISGGDVPTYRNGTSASTTIVSSVPVSITVVDVTNTPIQTAQVAVYLSSDDSELLNTDTDVNGQVSFGFGGTTPAAIYIRIRKSSTGATKYIPVSSSGTITSSGFSATYTLIQDTNVSS